jgi:hypothetical protein
MRITAIEPLGARSVDAMAPHHRETWRLRHLALIKT